MSSRNSTQAHSHTDAESQKAVIQAQEILAMVRPSEYDPFIGFIDAVKGNPNSREVTDAMIDAGTSDYDTVAVVLRGETMTKKTTS